MRAKVLGTCLCLAAAAACDDGQGGGIDQPDAQMEPNPHPDAGSDGGVEPPAASLDACARTLGTVADTERPLPVQLSAVHARTRFFSHHDSYEEVDAVLEQALGSEPTLDIDAALARYAEALPEVCELDAVPAGLGKAQVKVEGAIATIVPGTGDLSVPDGVTTVVVDLRNVPEVEGAWQALEAAVAPALGTPLARPRRKVREYQSWPDDAWFEAYIEPLGTYTKEQYRAQDVYHARIAELQPEPIPAGGKERTLLLLTGERLSPSAAEMACTLRLAKRARILGADVLTRVAESDVLPFGTHSVSVRSEDLWLWQTDARWPETVPADVRSDRPEDEVSAFAGMGAPGKVAHPAPERPELVANESLDADQSSTRDRASARALLLTAHATLRQFFPYFHLVGKELDPTLERVFAGLDGDGFSDDGGAGALQQLTSALEDGHSWALDLQRAGAPADPNARTLPFTFDVLDDGTLVVAKSAVPEVVPGSRLVRKGDTVLSEYVEQMEGYISTAQVPQRVLTAGRYWLMATTPKVEVEFVTPAGESKTMEVSTLDDAAYAALSASTSARKSGFLADLDAADVYYLNVDGASRAVLEPGIKMNDQMSEAITNKARAVILDMRGYPADDAFDILGRFSKDALPSPQWWIERQTGPHERKREMSQWTASTLLSVYDGPVVLLTGPNAQSAAETFGGLLQGNGRVTVVGRASAGTNGNITGVELPGRFGMTFTGMEVRNVDGSDFHARGVLPDVKVPRTVEALATGKDLDLQAAIDTLAAPSSGG